LSEINDDDDDDDPRPCTLRRKLCSALTTFNDKTMKKQEQHVNEYTVQKCINSSLNDLSRLANNCMKGEWVWYRYGIYGILGFNVPLDTV